MKLTATWNREGIRTDAWAELALHLRACVARRVRVRGATTCRCSTGAAATCRTISKSPPRACTNGWPNGWIR